MNNVPSPLAVLLVRDPRPGHFSQVEGVALALAKLRPVEVVQRIDVHPRAFARGELRDWLFNSLRLYPARMLNLLFDIQFDPAMKLDVVVSSGRKSLIAGSLIAHLTGARHVVSGFLDGYDPSAYDLMLVQSPRYAGEPHCAYSPLPNTVDASKLSVPRPLRSEGDLNGARMSLFLGGNAGSYKYQPSDWTAVAAFVAQSAARYGIRWSVSTSRRTKDVAVDTFRELAGRGMLETFVDYRKAGPGSNAPLMNADLLVVTEDSRSMTAESLATGRPVVLLRPQHVRFSMATEEITALAAAGGAAIFPIARVTPEAFAAKVLTLRSSQAFTMDGLASVLAPLVESISQRG
jgi:mitochondrial fission protein ELM1